MLPLVGALGGFLLDMGREWVADWKASKANTREVKRAVAENRMRLAESEQTHNQEWELRQLEGRDLWVRRLSFAMWSWPIFWAGFDTAGASEFFKVALSALPEWYVWGYLAMTGAIWGISEFKAMGIGRKGVGGA